MLQSTENSMHHPHSQRFGEKLNLVQLHWADWVTPAVPEQQRWCHLVGKLLLGLKYGTALTLPGRCSQTLPADFQPSDKLGMPPP